MSPPSAPACPTPGGGGGGGGGGLSLEVGVIELLVPVGLVPRLAPAPEPAPGPAPPPISMLGTIVLFPVLPVLPVLVLRVLLARGLILIAGIAIALFFPCLIVLFILPVAILVILIVVGRGSGAAGLLPELGPGAPLSPRRCVGQGTCGRQRQEGDQARARQPAPPDHRSGVCRGRCWPTRAWTRCPKREILGPTGM